MAGNIASERVRLGLTQEQLAKEIGVSRPVISRAEKDATRASGRTLHVLAEKFDCSVDYLLAITDDRKS